MSVVGGESAGAKNNNDGLGSKGEDKHLGQLDRLKIRLLGRGGHG